MNARLNIQQNVIMISEEGINTLNDILRNCPTVTEKYNSKTEKYDRTENPDTYIQLETTITIESTFHTK